MPFLGAHMPTAGGLHLAFRHIMSVGGQAVQIFTRNQRQWSAKPVSDEEAGAFAKAWKEFGLPHVFSHASYLINLASPEDDLREKSVAALADELVRCARLGIRRAVLHPGAHKGAGIEAGISRVARGLDAAFERAGEAAAGVGVLLENTAGAGTTIGADPEEIGAIVAAARHQERLGACWDTCHGFAAGHDPRRRETWDAVMDRISASVGLSRLELLHLNDSKTPLGGRVDRHEHIGKGEIGRAGFAVILNDPRLAHLPMTLETPKGKDLAEDRRNLKTLRGLMKGGRKGISRSRPSAAGLPS